MFDVVEEGDQLQGGDTGGASSGNQPEEASVPGETKDKNPSVDPNTSETKTGDPKVRGKPDQEEKFGEPANAQDGDARVPTKAKGDAEGDDAEPSTKATKEQEQAVRARKTLRKHLNAKVGMSPWSMPTPTPIVNPNRFHDPLDDKFWKDMWVAVAVHNVSLLFLPVVQDEN